MEAIGSLAFPTKLTIFGVKDLTIVSFNDTIVRSFTPNIVSLVGNAKEPIASIQSQISAYVNNQTMNDARTYSKLAENIRVALSVILFCWCGIIYIFVFLGILFK